MTLKESYEILDLPITANAADVDARYGEICERHQLDSSMENLKALAEARQAYFIILKHLSSKDIAVSNAGFSLQRKRVKGKTTEAVYVHRPKIVKVAAIGATVLISVSAFAGLFQLARSIDLSNIVPKEAVVVSEAPESKNPIPTPKPASVPIESAVPSDTLKPEVSANVTSSPEVSQNEHSIEVIDGVTYVDGYVVVNKSYPLPSDYVPVNAEEPVTGETGSEFLDKETLAAFKNMQRDASNLGLNLWIASGYRSYSYQARLFDKYARESGETVAETYSARAGYSEHQTGLAFDLNSVTQGFAKTREGIWVNENCHKYGFIIRYPKDKSEETGYVYEPWHLRYVGVELAAELYNGGDWITMEKHFGLTSQYGVVDEQLNSHTK